MIGTSVLKARLLRMEVDHRRLKDRAIYAVLRLIRLLSLLSIVAVTGKSAQAQTPPATPQGQSANPQPVATPPPPKTVSPKAQQDMQEYEESRVSSKKQPSFSSSVTDQRTFCCRQLILTMPSAKFDADGPALRARKG